MFSSFFKNDLSYDIDVNSKIIYLKFVGEVTSDSILKINKQVINDERFDWACNWIIDIRGSKQLFNNSKMDSVADLFKTNAKMFQNTKMAIIVRSPKQHMSADALLNLFETNNIKISVKKVLDKDLAYTWILGSTQR
jgi:hypothetical protein